MTDLITNTFGTAIGVMTSRSTYWARKPCKLCWLYGRIPSTATDICEIAITSKRKEGFLAIVKENTVIEEFRGANWPWAGSRRTVT